MTDQARIDRFLAEKAKHIDELHAAADRQDAIADEIATFGF